MKKNYLLLPAICMAVIGFGQYDVSYTLNGGNPGSLHSDDEFDGGGTWTSIYDCSTITPGSDIYTTNQTIPFSFEFNGSSVTEFKVSNAGYITFDVSHATPASSLSAGTLPESTLPDNSVTCWGIYADNQSSFAKIETEVFGSAGSQQLWIAFRSFYNPNGTDDFDFTYWSIVLEEGSNKIYVVRCWEIDFGGVWQDFPVSVGIQIDGTTAIEAPSNPITISKVNTSNAAADNDYWEFTYSGGGGAGIDDSQLSGLTIFPNPAIDIIHISEPADEVMISDLSGKTVLHSTLGTDLIDVSNLTSGVYIISLRSEKATLKKRITIQ